MRWLPKNQPLYVLGLITVAILYLGGIIWLMPNPTTKYKALSNNSAFEGQELINKKLIKAIADYKTDIEKLGIESPNIKYFDVEKNQEPTAGNKAKAESPKEIPQLKNVDAILVTTAGAIAIIDGVAMKEGQTTKSGERILAISSEQVKLGNRRGKTRSIGIKRPAFDSKNKTMIQDYYHDK